MHSILNESGIFDAVSGAAAVGKEMYNKGKEDNQAYYLKGSISKYTKDLIMTFPVLADTTVDMNSLNLINKAHEKNLVTMLQLLFTDMMIKANSGREALEKIHKNIGNLGLDEIIDILNDEIGIKNESAEFRALERKALAEMTDQLRSGSAYKRYKYDSINEKSLNEYLVRDINGKMSLMEAPVVDPTVKNAKEEELEKQNAGIYPLGKNQIKDGDIKKANELQPTLMVFNIAVNTGDEKNKRYENKTVMAGVKSRLIPVEAMDIVERLVSKNKSALSFKNLIRATSGEISFVKDFIFNIKQAKINAKNAVKKGPAAKMWDVLEKRSIQQNAAKIAKYGNDGSSIAALVINQETVNYLKSQFNINLENPAAAKMFMNAYCLLALIIADDVNEVAKFMYDGNDTFEVQSYVALSKEAADKAYKKLVNLINNGGR